MIKLVLSLFLAISCFATEPKFVKGQSVRFELPKFYSKVCSGTGTIESYQIKTNQIIYTVITGGSPCPLFWEVNEDSLTAVD